MENNQGPTLQQLADFLRQKKAEKTALTEKYEADVKEIDDVIEGIEELMLDTFPEGVDTQSVTLADGAKATIARKVKSQFRIFEGKSDEFYGWVQANGRADLLQRRIGQAALEHEVATNGLPPGIFVHTEPSIGMTVRRAAPGSAE